MATSEARRPTTRPLASISTHFFVTSAGFAEKVFIAVFLKGGCRPQVRRPNLARVSRERRGARQRPSHEITRIKTMVCKYGIIEPAKTSLIWNGIGRGDMGDWIGRGA